MKMSSRPSNLPEIDHREQDKPVESLSIILIAVSANFPGSSPCENAGYRIVSSICFVAAVFNSFLGHNVFVLNVSE